MCGSDCCLINCRCVVFGDAENRDARLGGVVDRQIEPAVRPPWLKDG